jgi:hypothetical protein
VLDATTQAGAHIDPFTGAAPNFAVLEQGPFAYGSIPADYLFQLHFDAQQPYRYELSRHLREWHEHEGRTANDRIVRFELWWLERDSPQPGSVEPGPTRQTLVFKGP